MPDDTEKKVSLDSRSPNWNPDPHPESAPAPKSGVERELIALFDAIAAHLEYPVKIVAALERLKNAPPPPPPVVAPIDAPAKPAAA